MLFVEAWIAGFEHALVSINLLTLLGIGANQHQAALPSVVEMSEQSFRPQDRRRTRVNALDVGLSRPVLAQRFLRSPAARPARPQLP